MRQQLLTAASTCIVTLLITLGFNVLATRLLEDKGKVTVESPIANSGNLVSEVRIENWSAKSLDGLILVVPASVTLPSVLASAPISIEEVSGYSGTADLKRLKFSGIPPNRVVRIEIPVPSRKSTDDFQLPNIVDLRLQSQWGEYERDPNSAFWAETMSSTISYAVLFGIFAYFMQGWFTSRFEKQNKRAEEIDAKYEALVKSRDELREELRVSGQKNRGEWLRYRMYLLSRLSEYTKELDFWRDAIRSILMSGGAGKLQAEEVIKKVSATLHTYGTQGRLDGEAESILEMARLLTKPEASQQS